MSCQSLPEEGNALPVLTRGKWETEALPCFVLIVAESSSLVHSWAGSRRLDSS